MSEIVVSEIVTTLLLILAAVGILAVIALGLGVVAVVVYFLWLLCQGDGPCKHAGPFDVRPSGSVRCTTCLGWIGQPDIEILVKKGGARE